VSTKRQLRNVTVTLEEDVARWARIEAACRDTSVSRLLGELLKERMGASAKICRQLVSDAEWNWFELASVRRAGGQRLAVHGVSVEDFRAEVKIGGAELFGLAQEEVPAGFKIKMETLDQSAALRAR